MDKPNPNAVMKALEHVATMRMIERNQSLPDATLKIIALDLSIVLERHLRGITEIIEQTKKP